MNHRFGAGLLTGLAGAIVAMMACGRVGSQAGATGTSSGTSGATVSSASCSVWQFASLPTATSSSYYPSDGGTQFYSTLGSFSAVVVTLPEGWEPFATATLGQDSSYLEIRHCVE